MAQMKCPPVRFSVDDCGIDEGWKPRRQLVTEPQPRYTGEEWALATAMTHGAAEAEQEFAERLQAEAARLAEETKERTLRGQQDVDLEFRRRLADMEHWRNELIKNFGDVNDEIDALTVYRQRIQNALGTLCQVIEVNSEIIAARECRQGIDLVHDDSHKQLLHEMKIVEGIQAVLKRTTEHCTEQLRLLRKCNHLLGNQLKDKDAALAIDRKAHSLDEHRSEVQRQCNPCGNEDFSNATEQEWKEATENLKRDTEKAVNASLQLRTNVDSLLRQVCEDLKKEICNTNTSIFRRVKELIEAKERLEEQHASISVKIRELEQTICQLRKSFEEKQGAIALAETRLCVRGKRPNLELIRDPVQLRLMREIDDNNESMAQLNSKILQANVVLRNLLRNQLDLEEQINVKTNSIGIDEVKVVPLRRTINIQEY